MEALNFDLFDLEAPEESLALPSLESLSREPRFTSPAALKPIADIPRSNYRIQVGSSETVFDTTGQRGLFKQYVMNCRLIIFFQAASACQKSSFRIAAT